MYQYYQNNFSVFQPWPMGSSSVHGNFRVSSKYFKDESNLEKTYIVAIQFLFRRYHFDWENLFFLYKTKYSKLYRCWTTNKYVLFLITWDQRNSIITGTFKCWTINNFVKFKTSFSAIHTFFSWKIIHFITNESTKIHSKSYKHHIKLNDCD